jgi:hypothetical protein
MFLNRGYITQISYSASFLDAPHNVTNKETYYTFQKSVLLHSEIFPLSNETYKNAIDLFSGFMKQ